MNEETGYIKISEQIRFLYEHKFSIKQIVDLLGVSLERVSNVCDEMERYKEGKKGVE